jgi:hypothetical protein
MKEGFYILINTGSFKRESGTQLKNKRVRNIQQTEMKLHYPFTAKLPSTSQQD